MKISSNYVIREIAGDYIIVPIGQAIFDFQGLITVNEIGADYHHIHIHNMYQLSNFD